MLSEKKVKEMLEDTLKDMRRFSTSTTRSGILAYEECKDVAKILAKILEIPLGEIGLR